MSSNSCFFAAAAEECYRTVLGLLWADMFGLGRRKRREILAMACEFLKELPTLLLKTRWVTPQASGHASSIFAHSSIRRYALWMSL
jgi:hypothetical protein